MLKKIPFAAVTLFWVYLLVDLKPFGPVDTLAVCAIGAVLMVVTLRWARR